MAPAIKSFEIQYWPLHGRADVMRMMLEAANKPYENVFVDPKEWATALKPKQRFGHIPVLNIKYENGTSATLWEGVAIDLYLAETLGFLPETQNNEDANFIKAECLGIYTSWLELSDKFSVAMARPTVEERRESVQKLRDDVVRLHVGFHEEVLAGSERNGPFYFGNKPTLADFMAVSTSLRMAELLGDDYASVNFPQLVKLKDTIVAIPQVGEYIQKRRDFGFLKFDKEQLKVVPASVN